LAITLALSGAFLGWGNRSDKPITLAYPLLAMFLAVGWFRTDQRILEIANISVRIMKMPILASDGKLGQPCAVNIQNIGLRLPSCSTSPSASSRFNGADTILTDGNEWFNSPMHP
jgi:hypothetical protein